MKIVIDLEDFWMEEDDTLESALKSHVTSSVLHSVYTKIKDQVEKEITKKVTETVKNKLDVVIENTLSRLIMEESIEIRGAKVSIVDHVKSLFTQNHGWSNPDKMLERIAKEFGEELKLQYNNAFATKIVKNMKEQGLLRDDVVQILLDGT